MPGALKKPLYIGSSLEELNRKVDHNLSKGQTAKICARSADKVFAEAEKADKNLDEERAYVMFMKYIALWQAVRKAKDYKQNKDFVDALLGKEACRKAVDKAEELSASLNLRYKELEEAKQASKKLEEEKERVKANGLKDGQTKEGEETSLENGVSEEEQVEKKRELGKDGVVDAIELYKELENSPNSVLVMDVRRSDHYRDSHMTIGQCMSIPAEIIKPGLTASTLEKGLGEDAKAMWKQRAELEFIVLVDWDQSQASDSSLSIVRAAMCKWDWGTPYKNPPLVLKGGYEDWLFKYPMYTNNPQAKKPVEKVEESKNLLDFDYPVFDDDKPPPPALPPQQANNAPANQSPSVQNGNGNGVYQNRMFFISGKPGQPGQPGQSVQTGQRPIVDRSVKPGASMPDVVASATNKDHTDSSRDKPKSAPAPIPNQINNNLESKTVAQTPDLANSGPASSTTKSTPLMPAVNRTLKPKIENNAANLNVKDAHDSNVASAKAYVNKPRTEPEDDSSVSLKESSVEAGKKTDAHLEELKKKEEQARNDLNKLRYDKTKAENEKLKEEKLEMERNLVKLQQELAEAKARQDRKRTPQKTSSPTHTPSPIAGKQDSTDSASSSSDATPKETSSASPSKKEATNSKSKESAVDRSAVQPNQNSNATTGEVKSVAGASSGAASASPSASTVTPPVAPSAAAALPKGWEKRWDEKSKRYYYLDHNNDKTQWNPPGEPAPRTAAAEAKVPSGAASTGVTSSKPRGDPPSSKPSTTTPGQVTRKPLKSDSSEPSAKSGGLKRSFSSPNIAQMVMNEGEASFNKPFPSIDRTTKPKERSPQMIPQFKSPSHSRVRQLNPVFGNQGRALTGLRNLGNTCFMNSVIQCLSNTTPLAQYFIRDAYLRDINRENPLGRGGDVVEEFAIVVTALWSGQYRSIAPRDLRDTVTKFVPEFRKHVGHHHDSQEFLLFLLDGLHEDLNEVKEREYIKEEDFSKYPDDRAAALSWRNHEKLNRSIIVTLFQGQFKSTVQCLSCNNTSVKFEAFMYLSLPIPSSSRCSLNDCLQRFSQPEKLTGDNATHCTRCKGNRNSKKTIRIWKLPKILLIHLKRFYFEGMWRQKLQTNVDFPNELTMDKFVIGPKDRDSYHLYGVSNHSGGLDGGHYTACCRSAVNRRWYKYDDHEVYDASQSSIKSSAAYILFYSSIPLPPP